MLAVRNGKTAAELCVRHMVEDPLDRYRKLVEIHAAMDHGDVIPSEKGTQLCEQWEKLPQMCLVVGVTVLIAFLYYWTIAVHTSHCGQRISFWISANSMNQQSNVPFA
jgi:hypothetical protein